MRKSQILNKRGGKSVDVFKGRLIEVSFHILIDNRVEILRDVPIETGDLLRLYAVWGVLCLLVAFFYPLLQVVFVYTEVN